MKIIHNKLFAEEVERFWEQEDLKYIDSVNYEFWSNCIGHGNSMERCETVRVYWLWLVQEMKTNLEKKKQLKDQSKIIREDLIKISEESLREGKCVLVHVDNFKWMTEVINKLIED